MNIELKRFDIGGHDCEYDEDATGEWVRFADVQALLDTPQPPALGGEPEADRDFAVYGGQCDITPDDEVVLKRHQGNAYFASMRHLGLAERAHLPDAIRTLQTESADLRIQYTACIHGRQSFRDALRTKRRELKTLTTERDTLKADLASAIADKEAYAQNAIDLRKQVDTLKADLSKAMDLLRVSNPGDRQDYKSWWNKRVEILQDHSVPAAKNDAQSTYVVEDPMDDPKPMKDGE